MIECASDEKELEKNLKIRKKQVKLSLRELRMDPGGGKEGREKGARGRGGAQSVIKIVALISIGWLPHGPKSRLQLLTAQCISS